MTRRAGAAALLLAVGITGCSTPVGTDASDGRTARASSATPASPSTSAGPDSSSDSGSASAAEPGSAEPRRAAAPLGIGTGWGPTRTEIRRARSMVEELTLRERAGQVIVARYPGTAAPAAMVTDLHLGGVIVMGENVQSTDQVRRSNTRLQRAVARSGRDWPAYIGVDQEGGVVERVQGAATRFPTFMTQGAARDPALTTKAAAGSGAELAALGFTVVYAPVADVTAGPSDPTIGSRSAGSSPRRVATQVNAAVDGYASSGVVPVIKHFPGHGSVPADSHEELPVQTKSLRRLRAGDLVPFRSAVRNGVPSVMVGHIDVRAVDPGTPSSLSRKVVTGLLREDAGYGGLVVTDALNMGAITDEFTTAESAVRALRAGVDVLLMPPSPKAARDGIVRAVRDGRLPGKRLTQAATRQVALLIHQRAVAPVDQAGVGSARGVSRRLSAAGVTLAAGPCSGRLVGRSVRASGDLEAVARFNTAARRAGLGTGSGTTVALVGYGGSARSAGVVVAMDTPYVLADSSAARAKIALYGDTPGAMRALVDVLLGRARAPGRLPVPVPGVPRTGC